MLNNPTERKVAMISLPMNGLTREEIEETKKKQEDTLKDWATWFRKHM